MHHHDRSNVRSMTAVINVVDTDRISGAVGQWVSLTAGSDICMMGLPPEDCYSFESISFRATEIFARQPASVYSFIFAPGLPPRHRSQSPQWSGRSVQRPWTVQNEAIQVVRGPQSVQPSEPSELLVGVLIEGT